MGNFFFMGPIGSQAESHKPHLPLTGTPAAILEAIQEALECLGASNSYIPVFWKPVPEEGEAVEAVAVQNPKSSSLKVAVVVVLAVAGIVVADVVVRSSSS